MRKQEGCLISVLLFVAGSSLLAQTQPASVKPKPPVFSAPAGNVFSSLVSILESGNLFPRASSAGTEATARMLAENMIGGFNLSEQTRFAPPFGWGGIWVGRNASGSIFLKIVMSNPLMKNRDTAEVSFSPAVEEPMPAPILSLVLGKAESTKIVRGDELDLDLPLARVGSPRDCISIATLTLSLSGALRANTTKVYCEPKP